MHISHPSMTGDQMFKKFENPRWQMAAILKIKKRDLQNRLTDFAEILYDYMH